MRNFPEMVAETSELVEPAIARIGLEGVAMVEAHNVRKLLIDLLEIAQRDPGLDAAADDLHAWPVRGRPRTVVSARASAGSCKKPSLASRSACRLQGPARRPAIMACAHDEPGGVDRPGS